MGFLSIKSIIPVGTVFPFAGTSAPEGWMMCDGRSLNNVDYPELFSVLGYSHGGNLTSTFNIPDYRGRFLRGSDNMGTAQGAAGRDPDRSTRTAMNANGNTGASVNYVGSVQNDQMQGHNHSANGQIMVGQQASSVFNAGVTAGGAYGRVGTLNDSSPTNTTNAVFGAISDGTNGSPRAGLESRPLNAYVNYIIKI